MEVQENESLTWSIGSIASSSANVEAASALDEPLLTRVTVDGNEAVGIELEATDESRWEGIGILAFLHRLVNE